MNLAAAPLPVIGANAADASGLTGLLFRVSLAGAPSSTTLTLPASINNCFLTLLARGCDVEYAVTVHGATAPTLVYGQLVTIGTGHAAAGGTIANGIYLPIKLPSNAKSITYMWSAATAGALFEAYRSSGRGA